jgi:hypothetical protein
MKGGHGGIVGNAQTFAGKFLQRSIQMRHYGSRHAKPQRRKNERPWIELCDLAPLREKIFLGAGPKRLFFGCGCRARNSVTKC